MYVENISVLCIIYKQEHFVYLQYLWHDTFALLYDSRAASMTHAQRSLSAAGQRVRKQTPLSLKT